MRARRPRRPTGLVVGLFAVLAAAGVACEGSPMDMWINRDPDAGWDFDAPAREVNADATDDDAAEDAVDDTAATGTGGSGGDTGSAGASGSGGAGGDTGSAGTGGDTGGSGGAGGGGGGGS